MAEETKPGAPSAEARTKGLRSLVIAAIFGVFLSSVVFVVLSYLFIIPRLFEHDVRIGKLEAVAAAVPEEVEEEEPLQAAEPPPADDRDAGVPPPSDVVPAAAPADGGQ